MKCLARGHNSAPHPRLREKESDALPTELYVLPKFYTKQWHSTGLGHRHATQRVQYRFCLWLSVPVSNFSFMSGRSHRILDN